MVSEPQARGAGWSEERAERGTSEHVRSEACALKRAEAERETW
jgi:hypothetical protein